MAIEAGDWARLAQALERFCETLGETTDPAGDGGRRVACLGGAVMLSEAASGVERLLVEFTTRLLREHGGPEASPGVRLAHADNPDGPWEPIEPNGVRLVSIEGGAAEIVTALEAARRAVSFPAAKWNAMQARRPGADHQRFHAGELLHAAGMRGVERALSIAKRLAGSCESDENDGGEYRSASWFREATGEGLYPDLLRNAIHQRRLARARKVGNRWQYPVEEVLRLWPEYSERLQTA
ncbi:MAG: hypothetical protein D6701_15635, partial [Gemmatimonadetes bacterium]